MREEKKWGTYPNSHTSRSINNIFIILLIFKKIKAMLRNVIHIEDYLIKLEGQKLYF